MSYPQTISKRSDTLQASPDTSASSVRETPKSFSSNSRFRRDCIVLIWRFFLTSLSLVFLMITLLGFSKSKRLSKWEQRSFNTISILATSTATLGLGSLLGYLGSMLRWPLLARTTHQIRDVDLILGMAPPTRSLRLIKRHIRERRISRTTIIVTVYLVTNILGRLSVAIFGLAINLKDEKRLEYPTLKTNWTSASWTRNIDLFADKPEDPMGYEIVEDFLNSAWNGMRRYGQVHRPDRGFGNNSDLEFGDGGPNLSDLIVSNATLEVGTDTVEYWYDLKDFKDDIPRPANHTAHSAVNCSLIEVGDGQYWRWDNWNRTGPFDWSQDSDEVLPRTLWVSKNSATSMEYPRWISFIGGSNGSYIPSQIYIQCDRFAWECWPTLTETVASKSPKQIQPFQRLFHYRNLYSLLGIHGQEYSYSTRTEVAILLDTIGNSPAQAAMDYLEMICSKNITMPLNDTIWNGYRLWVSGVVARLPILAIIHANTALPRIGRGPHPDQTAPTPYTDTTLEVKWLRVGLIAASITIGQFLTIFTVLYYCNGIPTRDDSHLATAELLKTVINTPGFDGSKLMTGKELAVSLDHTLKAGVSYGTRAGQDGGPPEVDLASGLDAKFPPFLPRATVLEEH